MASLVSSSSESSAERSISGLRHEITLGLEDQLLFAADDPTAKLDRAQSTKHRLGFLSLILRVERETFAFGEQRAGLQIPREFVYAKPTSNGG
jgi:hypothetical protein